MQVTASRVVAFVTPIFAAGAAALTPWLVKYTGLHVSATEVTTLAITGATSATAAALKWLHGNSQWERLTAEIDPAVKTITKDDPGLVPAAENAVEGAAKEGEAKLVAVIEPHDPPEAPADAFPPPTTPAA